MPETPACDCHGKPMYRSSSRGRKYWICAVRERERRRRVHPRYHQSKRDRVEEVVTAEMELRGGECECGCGGRDRLEWHHRDPDAKEFSIGERASYSPDRVRREIKKCLLLQAECHRRLHNESLKRIADEMTRARIRGFYLNVPEEADV